MFINLGAKTSALFIMKNEKKRKYPASRGLSLAWHLAFTKSFAWLVCRVVSLLTPCEQTNVKRKRQESSCLLSEMKRLGSMLRSKPLCQFSNDLFHLCGRRAAVINLFSATSTRYYSILRF